MRGVGRIDKVRVTAVSPWPKVFVSALAEIMLRRASESLGAFAVSLVIPCPCLFFAATLFVVFIYRIAILL